MSIFQIHHMDLLLNHLDGVLVCSASCAVDLLTFWSPV